MAAPGQDDEPSLQLVNVPSMMMTSFVSQSTAFPGPLDASEAGVTTTGAALQKFVQSAVDSERRRKSVARHAVERLQRRKANAAQGERHGGTDHADAAALREALLNGDPCV